MSDRVNTIFGASCLIMAVVLALLMLISMKGHCETALAANGATPQWAWDLPTDGPIGPYYQTERDDGTQNAFPGGQRTLPVALPDRTGTTPTRLRVRTCIDAFTCGAWSEWSEWVVGVQPGLNPDADGNGYFWPSDFDVLIGYFQKDIRWPQ